jgi:prepilin-type N-terminal cleavage/methylation domain-containing protein
MNKNQKGFSVVEILVVLVIIGLIGGVGWYVWQSKSKKAVTPNNSETAQTSKAQSGDEKTKSEASENQWRKELDSIKFSDFGFNKEGEAYVDYCEEHNESGTLNAQYVKGCHQHLMVYLSSSDDVATAQTQLVKIFQQPNRFIATNPKQGACVSGEANILKDSGVSYSKSKDLAIANHFSSQFVIRPADKSQLDSSYACTSDLKDTYFTPKEGATTNKSTTLDENTLQDALVAKKAKSVVILAFFKTYYKENI